MFDLYLCSFRQLPLHIITRCISKIMPPSKHTATACFAWAKYANSKFDLGKRCQRQPSANHIYNHTCVRKRLIDT